MEELINSESTEIAMTKQHINFLHSLLAILLLSLVIAQPAAAIEFTVTDLHPPGSSRSYGTLLNNAGQVVGYSDNQGLFLWQNGTTQALDNLLGASSSWATGINDAGQVVGWANKSVGSTAILWQNGTIQDLGSQLGSPNSQANGINNAGQVLVGNNIWQNGTFTHTNLPFVPTGINNAGQVVGSTAGTSHLWPSGNGVLWQNGTMQNLGSFHPVAINEAGWIAGFTQPSGEVGRVGLWRNGAVIDLGTLPSYNGVYARGINNQGQI